ncbi:MAG: ORF6C domain-containing protein [Anaerolineales bacterium]|nr:ORF6C domain-containing protein [Anaerolineales bacterium]
MPDKTLVPVVQKEVVFYEDMIPAVQIKIGSQAQIYVPIRPICDYLGLDWSAQYRRISRDPVLSEVVQGVAITTTPSVDGRGGGLQEMSCLPLKFLPGWLFGVSASRVKEELREKIMRYQRESYDVLWEAFQEGRLTSDATFEDLLANDTPAAQAYKMASAIMKMARQQILLEAQLGTHAVQLQNHEQRLEEIEATLGDPGHHITPEQAMQISQAVKTVAIALEQKTGKNEYGAVYGQLYREFGITSYKQLPANKFERAIKWLTNWYRRITGITDDDLPF